jgi:hypothetical protein
VTLRSFMPPDNAEPPARTRRGRAATEPRARAPAQALLTPAADATPGATATCTVQLTLQLPRDSKILEMLLRSYSPPAPEAAAAAAEPEPLTATLSNQQASASGEGGRLDAGSGQATLGSDAPGRTGDGSLEEIGCSSVVEQPDAQQIISRQQQYERGHKVLNCLEGISPESSATIVTADGRQSVIPRAIEDSGCTLDLMSAPFAKALGLHCTPLTAEQPTVWNIEGQPARLISHRTEPVEIVLARGTPGEVRLPVPNGFHVVEGDSAAQLYDVVLSRRLLAPIMGCVDPLYGSLIYRPRARLGDTTTYQLPVRMVAPPAVGAAAAAPMGELACMAPSWCHEFMASALGPLFPTQAERESAYRRAREQLKQDLALLRTPPAANFRCCRV